MLLIILVFVAVEQGMHKASPSAAPTAVETAQASTLPNARISRKPHPTQGKVHAPSKSAARVSAPPTAHRPFQLSHLQITDRNTAVELRDMTRYEIAKLPKDAQSGDDVAAFQLGMAYEIGYNVPQNCVQAAKWVARSAVQGDAAAEYNLGLRYRDGDGVTANPDEAGKWLRQAAAQNHSASAVGSGSAYRPSVTNRGLTALRTTAEPNFPVYCACPPWPADWTFGPSFPKKAGTWSADLTKQ